MIGNNHDEFDGLISKYTELLLGEDNEELREKVMKWALYSHIAKSMPALVQHWNQQYPEAKAQLKQTMEEIKTLNEKHRLKKQ